MTSRLTAASKPGVKASQPRSQTNWLGPSKISIFVRCLHLLDLDLLDDWPEITETVFNAKVGQQNLQQKVKAVEWSLYRLFELYNVEETKEKLRPFFPPNSPLQSLNLRAALYRFLSELKKNGVLGPHIQLRKTMLDECKGEKFEEAIAYVGMVVLRKVTQAKARPILRTNERLDESHLVPMILAHRYSLSGDLRQRNGLKEDTQRFTENVESSKIALAARKEALVARSVEIDTDLNRSLSNLVNENWIGNHAWAELICKGKPAKPVFESESFEDNDEVDLPKDTKISVERLVDDIDTRIRQHQNRLAEWKVIAKDLKRKEAQTTLAGPKTTEPTVKEFQPVARFGQHQKLRLDQMPKADARPMTMLNRYQDLLNSMHEELRKISQLRSDNNGRESLKTSGLLLESPAGAEKAVTESLVEGTVLQDLTRSTASSTDLTRGGNTPTDTPQVLHECRVEEDHQDLITPRKSPPQFVRDQAENTPGQDTPFAAEERLSVDSSPISSVPEEDVSEMWTPIPKSSVTTVKLTSPVKVSERIPSPDLQQSTDVETPSSPSKEWMSLVDRTRLSMSNLSSRKFPLEEVNETEMYQPSGRWSNNILQPIEDNDENSGQRRTTLAERTRQSMSFFPANTSTTTNHQTSQHQHQRRQSQHQRRKSQHHRLSQIFPVNQFETPMKASQRRTSEFGPSSESSTPREKLFEEEADYASVFKSRPKLAMSPTLTPQLEQGDADHHNNDEDVGFDSILEQEVDMERLQLAPDDEYD